MNRSKALRVIIVDDSANDAEVMISVIKSGGFAVRPKLTQDTDELSETLKNYKPDLVLQDIDSECIDLGQTLACIKNAGKYVPVIAVTSSQTADMFECMQKGAVHLVSKENREYLQLIVERTVKSLFDWRELKRMGSAFGESEKRCRMLLDSSRDSICYIHEGMHIYANPSYLKLFGYSDMEDVEGTPIIDMVTSESQKSLKEFLKRLDQDSNKTESLGITLKTEAGKAFDAHLEFSPASIDGESCTQIIIRNQSDTKELQEQLSYLSQRDVVTDLFNRPYFMEHLVSATHQAGLGEKKYAVIQLDIINIDEIRMAIGVGSVDLVLKDMAKRLSEQCEDTDILARFGENSFIVLTSHWEIEPLTIYANQLQKTINAHVFEIDNNSIGAHINAGATQIDENAPGANEILARVEKAIAQANLKGDNQFNLYIPTEGELTLKQQDKLWSDRLDKALQNGQLRMAFQPIVSLHGNPGERYEVYMRLLDEHGELVPAAKFMPAAERTGLAQKIDRWLLTASIEKLTQARQSGHDTNLFIKLTPGSIRDPEMLPWLTELIQESRVPPSSLTFEIKEEDIVSHLKQSNNLANGIKDLNCHFAIDAFGTGLNPLQLMKKAPADFLRIDRSLMLDINKIVENQEAIKTIIDTAHSMNKNVIATFVEDAGTLSILWGMGVNYIQGNFLQEPSEEMNYDFSAMG